MVSSVKVVLKTLVKVLAIVSMSKTIVLISYNISPNKCFVLSRCFKLVVFISAFLRIVLIDRFFGNPISYKPLIFLRKLLL